MGYKTEFMVLFYGKKKDASRLKDDLSRGSQGLGRPSSMDMYDGGLLLSKNGPHLLVVGYDVEAGKEDFYKSRLEGAVTVGGKLRLERSGVLVPV